MTSQPHPQARKVSLQAQRKRARPSGRPDNSRRWATSGGCYA